MILPWITLATVSAAVYSRLSRSSLLETLGEDYIRTARAKGLPERRVVLRHAMRSALTPVVSQLGIDVGTLLGGVVVVETVFGIGGIGQDSVEAIDQGNLPLIIGFVLAAAVFVDRGQHPRGHRLHPARPPRPAELSHSSPSCRIGLSVRRSIPRVWPSPG